MSDSTQTTATPKKGKFRTGVAWPEKTAGGAPKKGSMMNAIKAISELG